MAHLKRSNSPDKTVRLAPFILRPLLALTVLSRSITPGPKPPAPSWAMAPLKKGTFLRKDLTEKWVTSTFTKGKPMNRLRVPGAFFLYYHHQVRLTLQKWHRSSIPVKSIRDESLTNFLVTRYDCRMQSVPLFSRHLVDIRSTLKQRLNRIPISDFNRQMERCHLTLRFLSKQQMQRFHLTLRFLSKQQMQRFQLTIRFLPIQQIQRCQFIFSVSWLIIYGVYWRLIDAFFPKNKFLKTPQSVMDEPTNWRMQRWTDKAG